MPWTKETIFQRVDNESMEVVILALTWQEPMLAPQEWVDWMEIRETVNQLYVDKFEMADGTRYQVAYDQDNTKRWENRDPRFRKDIIIDREQHGISPLTIMNLYDPIYGDAGSDKTVSGQIALPYVVKKFWRAGVNSYDKLWTSFVGSLHVCVLPRFTWIMQKR